jgi:hypothetical protein
VTARRLQHRHRARVKWRESARLRSRPLSNHGSGHGLGPHPCFPRGGPDYPLPHSPPQRHMTRARPLPRIARSVGPRTADVRAAPSATRPEPRRPRDAGLTGAERRDALSKVAGLLIGQITAGGAFPAFLKWRCSESAVSTTSRRTTGRGHAGIESQDRDPHAGERPALGLTRYFCNRGLEQPASAMRQLLLVVLARQRRHRWAMRSPFLAKASVLARRLERARGALVTAGGRRCSRSDLVADQRPWRQSRGEGAVPHGDSGLREEPVGCVGQVRPDVCTAKAAQREGRGLTAVGAV